MMDSLNIVNYVLDNTGFVSLLASAYIISTCSAFYLLDEGRKMSNDMVRDLSGLVLEIKDDKEILISLQELARKDFTRNRKNYFREVDSSGLDILSKY